MFSVISSFRVDKTLTPLFTNPNVSLFPYETFADDKSSSLSQPTASLNEYPPDVELAESPSVVPSSPSVPPAPPLRRFPRVSQPFVLLRNCVCNSTIVTYEPSIYCEASSNSLWQKAMT